VRELVMKSECLYLCVGTYCVPVKEKTYVLDSLAFQITVNIHFLIIPTPIINLKSRRKFVRKYILESCYVSNRWYKAGSWIQEVESHAACQEISHLTCDIHQFATVYCFSRVSYDFSIYHVIYQCGNFHTI